MRLADLDACIGNLAFHKAMDMPQHHLAAMSALA